MTLSLKLIIGNAAVLVVSAILLAVMPTTVSYPVTLSEVATMIIGVGLMVVLNIWLVRGIMAPLDRLTAELATVRSADAARVLPMTGPPEVRRAVLAYNEMIGRVQQAQRASAVAALDAQEAERKRIARELHDEIGQRLTLALLQLSALPADEASNQARSQVEQSLTELRQLAARLRPGVLDDLGLRAALVALCNEISAQSPIAVTRALDAVDGLHPDQELAVYRIAQEALTNVLRHSGASRVEVSAGRRGADFVLQISDDGAGLGGACPGVGLTGMRERAELAGASLTIGTPERGGTLVILTIPDAYGADL